MRTLDGDLYVGTDSGFTHVAVCIIVNEATKDGYLMKLSVGGALRTAWKLIVSAIRVWIGGW